MSKESVNPLKKFQRISENRIVAICIPIILGQILAVLISLTAICNGILYRHKINLPLAINIPHYFLLAIFYGLPYLFYKLYTSCCSNTPINSTSNPSDAGDFEEDYNGTTDNVNIQPVIIPSSRGRLMNTLLTRLGLYSLVGVIDVHANWAIVSAYAYTSVTSVQLLDCITIPTVVLLSYFFLYQRYKWNHYIAIILCLIGATGMVLTDYFIPSSSTDNVNANGTHDSLLNNTMTNQFFTPQQMVFGDFLVIIGAVAYAVSNVLQHYLIVKYGIIEFLCCVGVVASVITLIYTVIFEQLAVSSVLATITSVNVTEIIACFIGYASSMFLLYSLMPIVLARSSAVL
uniref:Uncharacterized protein n=1 Tax=Trichobilharzia regenti TaxID=157069 RepID=A0AA85JZF8_TRIRE